jgi:hypothetical protein
LHTSIDGRENRGVADTADAGHKQQLRHRAVHFAPNELKEGHDRALVVYVAAGTGD